MGHFQKTLTIKFRRIKKRRGHKKAIIAICRMMLICIYHMIQDRAEFKPHDYEELMNPKPQKSKDIMTVEEAIKFLLDSGYSVTQTGPSPRNPVHSPPTAA